VNFVILHHKSFIMLNLITLNVRGLRNQEKRKNVFHWLNSKNCDICVLQEVYCCQNDIETWSKEYGGVFYSSSGSNHSKGILIGISNKVESITNVNLLYSDNEGRILGIKIDINENHYNLWNIYAPNDTTDRKKYFVHLRDIIESHSIEGHTIIDGDFNTVLNPAIDKIGGNIPNPACANMIKSLLDDFELTDIWRSRNGDKKRFTWKQNSPPVMCALDYWFTPYTIGHAVKKN
jgi:exonuclease III